MMIEDFSTFDGVAIPGNPDRQHGVIDGFTGSGLITVSWFRRDENGDHEFIETDIYYPGELERTVNIFQEKYLK